MLFDSPEKLDMGPDNQYALAPGRVRERSPNPFVYRYIVVYTNISLYTVFGPLSSGIRIHVRFRSHC